MLAMFVEKIIVFPTEFSENTKIIQAHDLQISFIRNVRMEGSDPWNLHKLPEDYCLPAEYELGMIMDDIGFEFPDSPDKRRGKTKGKFKIRVKPCRKTFHWEHGDARITEI